MCSGLLRGWIAGSSPTPTRVGPGRPRPPRCTPSPPLSRPAPPASSSTSTPPRDGRLVVCHDPTVDRTTDRSGAIADLTYDELSGTGQRLLVGSRSRRLARPRARGLPLPGSGPEGPPVRHRPLGGGARGVPRGGPQPRHQADRAGGGPLRGGPGRHAPSLRAGRRRDRGVVPRHGHRRLRHLRPRDPDLGRHGGGGRLLPGGPGRGDPGTPGAMWPSRCRPASGR